MTNCFTWVLIVSFVVLSKAKENVPYHFTALGCPADTCVSKHSDDYEVCIYLEKMCDGVEDCDDGSDERTEEDCKSLCPDWWCDVEKMCIYEYMICDGVQHCSDGSDEPDSCESRCSDSWCAPEKKCLKRDWVCDGEKDCSDGSDEPDNCDTQV